MIIYLVRHAEPKVSIGLTEREKAKVGLSNFGILQAKAVANKMGRLKVERIFSSPMVRALETASIIGNHLNITVSIDDNLKEFVVDFDSRNLSTNKSLKKEARIHPNKVMPGGESLNMAIERLKKTISHISQHSQGPICIVTHRVVLEGLLASICNINTKKYEGLSLAAVTALDMTDVDTPQALFYNRKALSLEILTLAVKSRIVYFISRVLK